MTNHENNIQSFIKSIRNFILENPKKICVQEDIIQLDLNPLGKGESNISILVEINKKYFLVFRIAQLYEDKIEKEFEILKKIPVGIGPKPIYLDTDKKTLPCPFLVESFVSGKNIYKWSKEKLSFLASSLALLHKNTKTKKKKGMKFVGKLKRDNNYFLKDKPELWRNSEIQAVISRTIKYLNKKEFLLGKLNQLSIIHGDLNTDNILLDNSKHIRFIDWELSHYNDPAREFSTFYYDDMRYLDWRIHLKSPQKERFLERYIKESKMRDVGFTERVWVWQIVDKAGAFIYCCWKALVTENNQEKAKFTETASLLKSSLSKMLTAA